MPIIQTPKELGLAIRSRRKALGWDQATLAKQVGVTRQWVIDIEKGKPRAELALAMRAVRVLGLSLNVDAKPEGNFAPDNERGGHPTPGTPSMDINAIVERNRGGAASHSPAVPSSAADYLKEMAARRLDSLASLGAVRSGFDPLAEAASASRLADPAFPKLPRTIADEPREIEATRRFDHPASAARPDDDRSESPAGSTRSAGTRRKAGESAKGKPASKRPGRER